MRQSRTSFVVFAATVLTVTPTAASRPAQVVVHGVELAIAPPATGVPASIASAKSSPTEGAYATTVVRNHGSTPIRSVVIAATVRSAGQTAAPPRRFESPRLVTWIPPGETQMLQPRLIDPATLKVLGTEGARVVASVARVEFGDGTVWPPDEPRQQAPETDTEMQFRAGAYSAGALPPGGVAPVVVRHVQPKYTTAAMRAKVEGIVTLEAVVGANGVVERVRIVRSLDSVHGLDQEALVAARGWLFRPATVNGTPVSSYVTIELEFRL
jgi:TonB family protein